MGHSDVLNMVLKIALRISVTKTLSHAQFFVVSAVAPEDSGQLTLQAMKKPDHSPGTSSADDRDQTG